MDSVTTNKQTSPSAGWMKHVRRVGMLTFVSRVLGLIRDMGMAAVFGNGPLLDAFTVAFRIPNLSRRLFGEGALTTAFLPRYVQSLDEDRTEAEQLAAAVLLILCGTLVLIILLALMLIWGLAKGDLLGSSSQGLLAMTAGLLPYVLFICLSAQLSAMLHAEQKFIVPALVPIVLNLVWILAIWGVVPFVDDPYRQMAVIVGAIVFGGLLQFLVPLSAILCNGFRLIWKENRQFAQARRVFLEMLPIIFGLSITQINAICDSTLAWWFSRPEQGGWIEAGTAAALYFGQRLYQFPLGIFGVALGTVLFAQLAHHVKSGKQHLVSNDVIQGLRFVLTIGIPASFGLVLLAPRIAQTLLEQGRFDEQDTLQTAEMIAAYGVGIWAYLGVILFQRVFYAFHDTRTPVQVGLATVFVNLTLNIPMMILFQGSGLAYATAIAAFFQVGALFYKLGRRLSMHWKMSLTHLVIRVTTATLFMSLFLLMYEEFLPAATGKIWQVFRLTGSLGLAMSVQICALRLLGVRELEIILGWRKGSSDFQDHRDLESSES